MSERVADFVVESRWDDVPDTVRRHGLRCIFNGAGTAIGGSSDPVVTRLMDALGPFSGSATATVLGRSDRFDGPTAAFLNAAATNVFDFDDTHAGTIIHPTAPIAPVVWAIAEGQRVSGRDLLHAFILGVEVTCRLGNAVSPGHYDRGWHITSTCGIFGAAVAAAKLLKLGRTETVWALGHASAQSSGMVETLGFMSKSVGVGGAARNGLLSALMARAGVTGPMTPLEGARGFLRVTCDNPRPERISNDLGARWEILRTMFKPYPCGVVLNPVIDACLRARDSGALSPERIASISVRGNSLLKARTDRPAITTGREAQVSAQHAVAVSLLRGTAGAADFSDAAATDPAVIAFRKKVVDVVVDASMPVESAVIEVKMANGERIALAETCATGSLGNPMTDEALKRKFATLVEFGCPIVDARQLADAIWTIPDLADAGPVLQLARHAP